MYLRGLRYLDHGRHKACIRIADRLGRRNYTGAFELRARSLWATGRTDEALLVLETGLQRTPQVWILWSFLGEFRSALGHYDLAIEAFENCASYNPHMASTSQYNVGLVHYRSGRPDLAAESLERVDLVPNYPCGIFAKETLALIQEESGDFVAAQKISTEGMNCLLNEWTEKPGGYEFARTFANHGRFELKIGSSDAARVYLARASEIAPFDQTVLELARMINNEELAECRTYRVLFMPVTRIVKSYWYGWVQASSEEEAKDILLDFYSDHASLGNNVISVEPVDEVRDNLKGMVAVEVANIAV